MAAGLLFSEIDYKSLLAGAILFYPRSSNY